MPNIIDEFEKNKTATSVNIDVPGDEPLEFPDGGQLVLNGRRLIVAANKFSFLGTFSIVQFDASDTPGPITDVAGKGEDGAPGRRPSGRNGYPGKPGKQGKTGKTGRKGKNAPLVFLETDEIVGDGTLTIVNRGGSGGRGGKGGKGGTGGRGENGADGSDALVGCKAGGGDGGNGGPGGLGGRGGTGGQGGKGGKIRLSAVIWQANQDGKVTLDFSGGDGGPPGDPGDKGEGGEPGLGGAGSTYCDGGKGGSKGSDGAQGPSGSQGLSGQPGSSEGL